jgi:hypothetical protein
MGSGISVDVGDIEMNRVCFISSGVPILDVDGCSHDKGLDAKVIDFSVWKEVDATDKADVLVMEYILDRLLR